MSVVDEQHWKTTIANLQLELHNSYIRIKELNEENEKLKKLLKEVQLEFDFNANI
tara:strand:+ start:179 stop:343 length:165 start_codon:yes stop_codon:yes gene_type:complete